MRRILRSLVLMPESHSRKTATTHCKSHGKHGMLNAQTDGKENVERSGVTIPSD